MSCYNSVYSLDITRNSNDLYVGDISNIANFVVERKGQGFTYSERDSYIRKAINEKRNILVSHRSKEKNDILSKNILNFRKYTAYENGYGRNANGIKDIDYELSKKKYIERLEEDYGKGSLFEKAFVKFEPPAEKEGAQAAWLNIYSGCSAFSPEEMNSAITNQIQEIGKSFVETYKKILEDSFGNKVSLHSVIKFFPENFKSYDNEYNYASIVLTYIPIFNKEIYESYYANFDIKAFEKNLVVETRSNNYQQKDGARPRELYESEAYSFVRYMYDNRKSLCFRLGKMRPYPDGSKLASKRKKKVFSTNFLKSRIAKIITEEKTVMALLEGISEKEMNRDDSVIVGDVMNRDISIIREKSVISYFDKVTIKDESSQTAVMNGFIIDTYSCEPKFISDLDKYFEMALNAVEEYKNKVTAKINETRKIVNDAMAKFCRITNFTFNAEKTLVENFVEAIVSFTVANPIAAASGNYFASAMNNINKTKYKSRVLIEHIDRVISDYSKAIINANNSDLKSSSDDDEDEED